MHRQKLVNFIAKQAYDAPMMASEKNLRQKLAALSQKTSCLDPTPEQFSNWLSYVAEHCAQFREDLHVGKVSFPDQDYSGKLPKFANPPQSFQSAIDTFFHSLQSGFNPSSGRFFGYVPGGGVPIAAIADFIAALTNRYAGVYRASPIAAEIENECIRWLVQQVGFGEQAWGNLTSGGTTAILSALIAARESHKPDGKDARVIYMSSETHRALHKAIHIAGLSHLTYREIPVNTEGQIKTNKLLEQIDADQSQGLIPWFLGANAGTVNTGAVDDLQSLGNICKQHDIWFHVDGAYGGCFLLTEQGKSLLNGIQNADSVVLDPHKGFFLPYGTGAVLIKEGKHLKMAFKDPKVADYLQDVLDLDNPSPADYSPELTRHFRGLRLWLLLQIYGSEVLEATLQEKLYLAQYAYEKLIDHPKIILGPKPQLSIVTYRLADNHSTQLHLNHLLAEGSVHMSTTKIGNDLFIRICILNFRSHLREVDHLLDKINAALQSIAD